MHTHTSLSPAPHKPHLWGMSSSSVLSPWPQREKKRILFLYNELLRKRAAFTQLRRATIMRRARQQRAPVSPGLCPWLGLRTDGKGHLPSVHPAPTKVPGLLMLSEF